MLENIPLGEEGPRKSKTITSRGFLFFYTHGYTENKIPLILYCHLYNLVYFGIFPNIPEGKALNKPKSITSGGFLVFHTENEGSLILYYSLYSLVYFQIYHRKGPHKSQKYNLMWLSCLAHKVTLKMKDLWSVLYHLFNLVYFGILAGRSKSTWREPVW